MILYTQKREREVKTMFQMIRAISVALVAGITFGIFVWFSISYIDVFMHNLTPNYVYPKWNFFEFFLSL